MTLRSQNNRIRSIFMNIKTISTGIAAGSAIGLMCYAFTMAGPMKKHSIKKKAGKTLKAASDLLEDITSLIG